MRGISLIFSLLFFLQLTAEENGLDKEWYRRYLSQKIIHFASLFEGVKYDYANTDPLRGFDCSGFVQFVYGNFNVKVPRSSAQFDQHGVTIPLSMAEPGDILLFSGSNPNNKTPSHLGIISDVKGTEVYFLHSATSNGRGIMTSALSEAYFSQRFIKVIRVL